LLNSRRFHSEKWGPDFYQDSSNFRGGRQITGTLTYSFGNMKAKRPTKKPKQSESMDNYNGYGEEME
jgi:hypothetical protein